MPIVTPGVPTTPSFFPQVFDAMLHVAGAGATYRFPMLIQGTPEIEVYLDSQPTPQFGQLAPTVRTGILRYISKLTLHVVNLGPSRWASFQALLSQVMATGASMYYRDRFGHQMPCAFHPDQQKLTLQYTSSLIRYPEIVLMQVGEPYSPSTTQGSALGKFQQVHGSIVPLSPLERIY